MLDNLDDRALDDLPFGVVCLDEGGTVVRFNRTEQERSGIQRWRALGRSFFKELAPGDTQELAEHIDAFLAGREAGTIRHTFKRRTGADTTRIELERGDHRVYLKICRGG
jgi:photoactive yellow protein